MKMDHTLIKKYFPNITAEQEQQYAQLEELYKHWNAQINVISRKDIDDLYCHHILHSLGILQMLSFKAGSKILDFGCGGGFPGIPLAIMFPDVEFLLVDSIGKKIKVATAVAQDLGLKNVRTLHARGEGINGEKFDFVVSRAVMRLDALYPLVKNLISSEQKNALPNGLICLKGGDLNSETAQYKNKVDVLDLYPAFEEEFFQTKKVVYLPIGNK